MIHWSGSSTNWIQLIQAYPGCEDSSRAASVPKNALDGRSWLLGQTRRLIIPSSTFAPRPREHKEAVANYARGFASSSPAMIQSAWVHGSQQYDNNEHDIWIWLNMFPSLKIWRNRESLCILVGTSLLRLFCLPIGCGVSLGCGRYVIQLRLTPANPHRHHAWLHHLDNIQGDAEAKGGWGLPHSKIMISGAYFIVESGCLRQGLKPMDQGPTLWWCCSRIRAEHPWRRWAVDVPGTRQRCRVQGSSKKMSTNTV